MSEFDQLNLAAEIAAALLGFIAIFVALSNSDGRFSESDRHFVQAMVLCAALAIVLAMLPRVLILFVNEEAIWRVSVITGLVLGTIVMALQAKQQFTMSRHEAAKIHWLWHTTAWMLGVIAAILLAMALLDVTRTSAYFVAAVSMMILLSLTVFIAVVFRRFF